MANGRRIAVGDVQIKLRIRFPVPMKPKCQDEERKWVKGKDIQPVDFISSRSYHRLLERETALQERWKPELRNTSPCLGMPARSTRVTAEYVLPETTRRLGSF
ncbi:hypothetical protein NPIL_390671 [Nephila pilipes]|uniref:Uncharacterized protein n=1 Tax=Nephila pilipes TaxID=299642 RepID=A0A8X6MKY8_NEPPI|nr:hypothetical protein NPIL_390671 [Nephila pilipes]